MINNLKIQTIELFLKTKTETSLHGCNRTFRSKALFRSFIGSNKETKIEKRCARISKQNNRAETDRNGRLLESLPLN